MRSTRLCALVAVLVLATCSLVQVHQSGPARTLEIRSYTLKPGTRPAFHDLFVREVLPLLRRAQIDVVAYGPSMHDADSYFLMRAFDSAATRQAAEDAFYGAEARRRGPREAVLSRIAHLHGDRRDH